MANEPLILKLATDRQDKGQTPNYRVYAGGGNITLTKANGEAREKCAVLGGNGTVYIANELSAAETEYVLMPGSVYRALTAAKAAIPAAKAPRQRRKTR